jgi:hypothetical protein
MIRYRNTNYRVVAADEVAYKEPTPEMDEFFETRTAEHIARVQKYLEVLESFPGLDIEELLQRGEGHDVDKYEMRVPYTWVTEYHRAKNNGEEISDELQEQYDLAREATGKHVTVNRHHPEAHESIKDMTTLDLAEMVSDWFAMGEELGTIPREWADQNVGVKWEFSPKQEETIYKMIGWLEQ